MRLPPRFKTPTLDKFDGTSCPKFHLKMYMKVMQPLRATEELLTQMFQNTLTRDILRWFLNLDDAKAGAGRTSVVSFTINISTT